MILRRTPRAATLAVLTGLALAAPTVHAQTLVTGTHNGVPGAPGPGNPYVFPNSYAGNPGGAGYGGGDGSYIVSGAVCTGGAGGAVAGAPANASYLYGGEGGGGLALFGSTSLTATISSGTFTGGTGGAVTGTAAYDIVGGHGGDGMDVGGSTVVINGGTFQGGAGGPETGTAAYANLGQSGAALFIYTGTVTINGGTFSAGSDVGHGSDGAVVNYADAPTTLNIYGGTFSGGTLNPNGAVGGDLYNGSTTTLYGTGFTITPLGGSAMSDFTGAVPVGQGTITGTLQNNGVATTFTYDNEPYNTPGGGLFIVPSPEPSPSVALILGALGLSALAVRARRRPAA